MRSWLEALPKGDARSAAFDTRLKWSPAGAAAKIERRLRSAGYRPIGKAMPFIVIGGDGPLREGELERARQWGAELARAMG